MSDDAGSQDVVYVVVHADREHHEELVRDLVAPVASKLRDCPELDSLFFVRFNVPEWHLRFRVLGRPAWIAETVRPLVGSALATVESREHVRGSQLQPYEREYERYGGAEGVALAESLFLQDTLACLDLMQAERDGLLERSRREYHLSATERLLDLLRFDTAQRLAFYEYGYRWTIESGTWSDEDFKLLEARFRSLEPGLVDLVDGAGTRDPEVVWGGAAAAGIAGTFLRSAGPVLERVLAGHAAGRIRQDLIHLAWSYTHLSSNRLGIDPPAEAILRFFMHRLYQERSGVG